MSKLGDKFKDGRIVGAVFAVGALAAVGAGLGVAATSANAEKAPAAVVETIDAVNFASLPYTNGLAGEQETDAAAAVAAEQARIAAEAAAAAEAARVAAEQAAAAEAERVAAEEQAAADEAPAEDPEEPSGGGIPAIWVDLGNGTGIWDFSHCPTQSGSTGADGGVYCAG